MKLRNKKTGEPGKLLFNNAFDLGAKFAFTIANIDGDKMGNRILGEYSSLAELNEEWEDYEEPKVKKHDFYYINENGGVLGYVPYDPDGEDLSYMKYQKEIGNHFKTREEAKKAVEKLKAWKRLKDKGFRFKTWGWEDSSNNEYTIYFTLNSKTGDTIDLDLLFSGEEDE